MSGALIGDAVLAVLPDLVVADRRRRQASIDHLTISYEYGTFSVAAVCRCGWKTRHWGLSRDKTYLATSGAATAHKAEATA